MLHCDFEVSTNISEWPQLSSFLLVLLLPSPLRILSFLVLRIFAIALQCNLSFIQGSYKNLRLDRHAYTIPTTSKQT